jgi:hypothetical protein
MFWILMLVLPGLVMSILHAIFRAQWSRWISLGIIVLVLAIGLYGRHQGRTMTDGALDAVVDASDRESLREEGYKEASRPIQLALIVDGILLVGFVIGELRRRARSRLQ